MLHGAFGEKLGRSFGLASPPTLISRTPRGLPIAATEIRVEKWSEGFTEPIASEDAYLIGLQLRDVNRHEMWMGGRQVSCGAWQRGATTFYDLAQHPVLYCDEPFHQLIFYASRRAIADVCDDFDPRGSELNVPPGHAVNDKTIRYLGKTLLPYLQGGHSARVVDHLLYALCGHVAERYGARTATRVPRSPGGLAPWQQRRARELMRNSLTQGVSLQAVADACHLSASAFVKGFKKSMGIPPHQWLLMQRVERSIDLMQSSEMPLVDVALACGFSDQSHFTRMFTQKMGVSPGAYRRAWQRRAAAASPA
jgi:AraC-like DNA-binding protein